MWNTAGPDDFAGNAASALRVMFWMLYLLLVGALAITARTLASVIRHRSLRDARAATSTAMNQLNAWTAATSYRFSHQSESPPTHDRRSLSTPSRSHE